MITTIMRRTVGVGALVAAALLIAPTAGAEARAATSLSTQPVARACPTVMWGSVAKTDTEWQANTVTDVRVGRHACFDRLVIDLSGPVAGYDVRYVPVVHQSGSGSPMALRGGAAIEITVTAATYNSSGRATYAPARPGAVASTTDYQTFRQVALAGSFEGETTLGLGVRARLPMRTFLLAGPGHGSRLVVDVAHHW